MSLLVDGDVVMGLGFELRSPAPTRSRSTARSGSRLRHRRRLRDHPSWGDRRNRCRTVTAIPSRAARRDRRGAARSSRRRDVALRRRSLHRRGRGQAGRAPSGACASASARCRSTSQIEKIGEAQIVGPRAPSTWRFSRAATDRPRSVELDFVRGHFWKISESDRLRAPAFERRKSGFETVLGRRADRRRGARHRGGVRLRASHDRRRITSKRLPPHSVQQGGRGDVRRLDGLYISVVMRRHSIGRRS